MENITEWAGKLDKNTRNKPAKQLQDELFHRIDIALEEGSNTFDECVAAFCRFDARVIETFYEFHYWKYSDEKRAEWDKAMIRWAGTNTGKQTVRATVRIVPIVKVKLPHVEDVSEVLPELKWLSVNGDDRSASAFKQLRENSKVSDLRKLLPLDMNAWISGQAQIYKMFGIIFADSLDTKTQELYADFLARHGKSQEQTAVAEDQPVVKTAAEVAPGNNAEESIPAEQSNSCTVKVELVPDIDTQSKAEEAELPIQEPVKELKKEVSPADGVALAEALVKWVQTQKEKNLEIAERNAALSSEVQKQRVQIDSLIAQIGELTAAIERLKTIKVGLEADVDAANAEIEELKAAKEKAESTIGQVQQMSGNSVKQELDGFKAKLASALANDAKDFRGEYSEEEKAEVYSALLEDMIDILKSNGISVEEN